MRVAVAYDKGKIFQHFGHTKHFKVYDIEKGEVVVATTINTGESGHGALADILKKCGIDVLICGGIGEGAKRALDEAKITLYGGVEGDAECAIADLLANKLKYDSNVQCSHSGEHHEGSCGEHEGICGHCSGEHGKK